MGMMMRQRRFAFLLLLGFFIFAGLIRAQTGERFSLGAFSAAEWDGILAEAARLSDPGASIALISARFLGTPYRAGTLIGDETTPEVLVVDLGAVDCFTLLDYVEALRRSNSFAELRERLVQVRYRDGQIAYTRRHHFFTDWAQQSAARIRDVTEEVGGGRAESVRKRLNEREDGRLWLPGIPVRERTIRYLPTEAVAGKILAGLRTGDYVGIYSERPGLDVSHTGIIIRKGGRVYLRHASSRKKTARVVDCELLSYLADKPGLVVLRPR